MKNTHTNNTINKQENKQTKSNSPGAQFSVSSSRLSSPLRRASSCVELHGGCHRESSVAIHCHWRLPSPGPVGEGEREGGGEGERGEGGGRGEERERGGGRGREGG